MSFGDGQGPAEFRPVKLGPRRRRFDPLALGVVVVVAALVLAIIKPWDLAQPRIAAAPSAAPSTASSADPGAVPSPDADEPLAPPTWSDIVPVVTRHPTWGIRTIVLSTTAAGGAENASGGYAEHWYEAGEDAGVDSTAFVDGRDGAIIALGVTFPPEETPLDIRIWKDHAGGELEWMDVRPVDDVPARGANLYVRRGDFGQAVTPWEPGHYRVDILVGAGIERIDLHLTDASGRLPDAEPWAREPTVVGGIDTSALQLLPQGLFALARDQLAGDLLMPVDSAAGPVLDEYGAWLDVDLDVPASGPRQFVGQVHHPDPSQIGVILPAFSSIRSFGVDRVAPAGDSSGGVRRTALGSAGEMSFVAFGPLDGLSWTPGVYAVTVAWDDAEGSHERTWHLELRPGPVPATPVLLAATRAWSRFVGSSGVLLGVPEPLSGTDPLGVALLGITPQTATGYPGLSGSDLIGCGDTVVQGRPEVIGIVGDPATPLTPVTSRILYPFSNIGPLEILTAAGAVPGLTLAAPLMTAELLGPASYGFRAGSSDEAPGYTICIGLGAG